MRYADPTVCPDCRSSLPSDPRTCPTCDLPLDHRLATELFGALQRADALLVSLRAATQELPPLATYPAPAPRPATPRRTGPTVASVPRLLLSLGALCLLVAAAIFLAVAWSWLGIGGRTAVLVGLTTALAAASVRLDRRDLRIAAEALATVALGLVLMDVAGAIDAGWFGSPDISATLTIAGAALGVVSLGLLALSPRLYAVQVAVAVAAGLLLSGIDGMTGHDDLFSIAAVLALAALARLGRETIALLAASGVLASLWWCRLLVAASEEVAEHPSLHGLWVDGRGYAALAAAALLVLPGLVLGHRPTVVGGAAGAAVIATTVLATPALDETGTVIGVVALALLLAWTVAAVLLPKPWELVTVGPVVLAALPAGLVALEVVVVALDRLDPTPWTRAADTPVVGPDAGTSPLLLVPIVAALLVAAAVWLPRTTDRRGPATALGVAAVLTLASYDVPLVAVVVLAAALSLALRSSVLAVVAVAVAMPSAVLVTGASVAAIGTALLLRRSVRSDVLLPVALTIGLCSLGEALALDADLRAYPVVAALGLLVVARPRETVESVSAICAAVVTASAVTDLTALAVHLTLAGALVTVSAVVNPERRLAGWVGGAMLAVATWLRLHDVGVVQPEAYTLPTAVALVLVALYCLRRDDDAPTWLLVPGLTLATVPSLLWVLDDPVSTRAVLLGGACLGLVLAGSRLRWSAPLAVGGTVGALLVLRELAPYAGQTPQWVLIGCAGAVLIAVGVTWEQRLLELRRATSYLGNLR